VLLGWVRRAYRSLNSLSHRDQLQLWYRSKERARWRARYDCVGENRGSDPVPEVTYSRRGTGAKHGEKHSHGLGNAGLINVVRAEREG
jgi:hypothetical protein